MKTVLAWLKARMGAIILFSGLILIFSAVVWLSGAAGILARYTALLCTALALAVALADLRRFALRHRHLSDALKSICVSDEQLPPPGDLIEEDYARLTEAAEAGDAAACEAARRALLNAVRTEGKRIGKYIVPPHTTDFAVMFLPLEGLYAEVMRSADVVETLQREQRILVAGPSTLLALLNSLQMGFRTLAIEQRSAEVWKLLGAVKTDFGSFAKVLEHTQEKLRQASDSIDSAFVRTRSIEKRLRSVEALEETETEKYLPTDSQE